MTFQVQIKVMPLKDLLDPQGKAVLGGLHNLGMTGVKDVRVGKHITLQIEAANEAAAKEIAETEYAKNNVVMTTQKNILTHPDLFHLIPFNPNFG
jgi:phosphoribosylformylglycinamidine synthase